jgi:hypothetical protein
VPQLKPFITAAAAAAAITLFLQTAVSRGSRRTAQPSKRQPQLCQQRHKDQIHDTRQQKSQPR